MGDDWSRYPFELVPGDPQFRFPAAEANHQDCESDTWFVAGELAGESGRNFAFLTIFNKNRPGQLIVADFYTFALFDLDSGTYATYTDYDMPSANRHSGAGPKLSVANDHLDMTYESGAGTAVWRTSRDERDELVPYTYDVEFNGADQSGAGMRLDLRVTPSRSPVPLGAAAQEALQIYLSVRDEFLPRDIKKLSAAARFLFPSRGREGRPRAEGTTAGASPPLGRVNLR